MKKDDEPEERRKVGYKSPPIHSRFKPGTSGNPKGRPKPFKIRNVKNDLRDIFLKKVRVKVGDTYVFMSKIEALYEVLVRESLKGNMKSAALAVKLADQLGVLHFKDDVKLNIEMLTPEERQKMNDTLPILHKIRSISPR